MATAPKSKPAKAAGLSPFQQAVRAARELWLGSPAGELQSTGEIESEAYHSEVSTREAIDQAQPTEKLRAFDSGFCELEDKLCASVINYYNTCFELALDNREELEGSPAEFARSCTAADLSTFLRVTPLDGNERTREIDSNGRVREFVRHACGDYFDVVPSLVAEQSAVFLFPRWPTKRSFGSKIGQMSKALTPGAESNTLTIEETEAFILSAEETLITKLRRAIADAHRKAIVQTEKTPAHAFTVASSAAWPKMPEYKSELKKAVYTILGQKPDANDRQLCDSLDEIGSAELPPEWAKYGNRSFVDDPSYADNTSMARASWIAFVRQQ